MRRKLASAFVLAALSTSSICAMDKDDLSDSKKNARILQSFTENDEPASEQIVHAMDSLKALYQKEEKTLRIVLKNQELIQSAYSKLKKEGHDKLSPEELLFAYLEISKENAQKYYQVFDQRNATESYITRISGLPREKINLKFKELKPKYDQKTKGDIKRLLFKREVYKKGFYKTH